MSDIDDEIAIHEARTEKPRFHYSITTSDHAWEMELTGTFGVERTDDAKQSAHEWVDRIFHAMEAD